MYKKIDISTNENDIFITFGQKIDSELTEPLNVNTKVITLVAIAALGLTNINPNTTEFKSTNSSDQRFSSKITNSHNSIIMLGADETMGLFKKKVSDEVFQLQKNEFTGKLATNEEKLEEIYQTMATKADLVALNADLTGKIKDSVNKQTIWILTGIISVLVFCFVFLITNPNIGIKLLEVFANN